MTEEISENDLIAIRRAKLDLLRIKGNAYPNDFKRSYLSEELHQNYGKKDNQAFEKEPVQVAIAGRIMLQRIMGKASFITLQDMDGQIQAYLRSNDLPEGHYDDFKTWDLGDIVGIEGRLFKTKTNEFSYSI